MTNTRPTHCSFCGGPLEQKAKGRPTEAHRNCVVARSLIAQLGDALRGIEQWEDRKLKQVRGSIMAETINGPLHYGKTRNKTLVRIDTTDDSVKLFNPKMPPEETIEFLLINEVSIEDWMKPYMDFTPEPGDRIYQLDFMPHSYEQDGVFHCMFFKSLHDEAYQYAKHKAKAIGAKLLLGDDAKKTLRAKRIFDRSVWVTRRESYYYPFQTRFCEYKQGSRRKNTLRLAFCGFMKKRYREFSR